MTEPARARRDPRTGEDVLDLAIAEFERRSARLVLLDDDVDLRTLEVEVDRFAASVRAHAEPRDRELLHAVDALHEEHLRYLESLEVLNWLLAIVRRDDHGGNRQALGQYGKVLVESLRAHRRAERARNGTPRTGSPRIVPGQP